jgi:hypothetical protein
LDRGAGLLGDLELNRPACLLLNDGGPVSNSAAASLPTFDHDSHVRGVRPFPATQPSRREWFFMPPERTLGLRGGSCSSCPISVSLVFEGYVCFRQAARGAEMTGIGAKVPSAMKVGTGSFR